MSARRQSPQKTEKFQFRLEPKRRKRWEKAAEAENRSLSDWVRLTLDKAAEQKGAA